MDVVHWVERVVAQGISDDHRLRSPACQERVMRELMIPTSGAEYIGGPSAEGYDS